MQDRYAGDVGDFVKLGLLRMLSVERKLGIAWYRFPNENHNNDGRHISYLERPEWYAALDPPLFHHLKEVVRSARSISSLLPMLENAEFYEESLNVASCPISERRRFRKAWFAGALEKLAECDIVFADPDNGIVDDDDRRKGSAKFGKQIPIDEIRRLAEGRCAIIYHHNTRRPGGHDAEVNHLLSEIALPSFAIRAKAHSPRTFFVINADEEIAERCKIFCERWGKMKVSLYHQL